MSRPAAVTIALLAAAILFPVSALAQNEPLYEASVPVADQSESQRVAALRAALGAVLVKVTGDREAPARQWAQGLLGDAGMLVQQFRYERQESVDAEITLHLRARFDPAALLRALRERSVPIWGRERPATLVWLAYDDGTTRGLVDSTAPPEIRAAIEGAAMARGLPLVWPLLDLEDRAALPFADLWGGFDERIDAASERYRANAVLVGRLYRVDDARWAVRWNILETGSSDGKVSGPGSLDEVAAVGPQWVADRFAERYALVPTAAGDGRTRLVVAGVTGVGEYASVMRYLGSLSPVRSVELDGVDRDEVIFALDLRGTPEQVQQAIALGSRLVPEPTIDDFDLTLRYAIRP
ncbi:MAG: DUF2066 domain-containing protein [Xanthomonadaceae bacterium]|nr:DUF2066 domain-containing protein [Xanthomonadaceae bacterium]